MAQTSTPFGFWRFVIVSSAILSVLRHWLFPGGRSDFSKPFWFSVFLWAGYRVARLQPWWPFPLGRARASTSDYQQVIVTPKPSPSSQEPAPREAKFSKPLTADDLRIDFRRQAAKAVKAARKAAKVQSVSPTYSPSPASLGLSGSVGSGGGFGADFGGSVKSPSKLASASAIPISNVGERSKVSRSKTVRHKTTRRKRRS